MDPVQDGCQRVEVHRFLKAVAYRLFDQWMVRNRAVARNIFHACGRVGKHRRHQIVGQHPLQLRRHFTPASISRNRERNRCVPPPAGLEHRRVEERLRENVAGRRRMQVAKDVGQGKRVLRTK